MATIRHENMFFREYVEQGVKKFELVRIVKSKIESCLIIPHQINGIPVCRIGAAFEAVSKLQTVKCPDSVEKIQDRAFTRCPNLTQFEFYDTPGPASTLWLGKNAFSRCIKLKRFHATIPVEVLDDEAFYDCAELLTVDASIKHLGHKAFSFCPNLSLVTIAHNGSWKVDTFSNAKSLKDIYFVGAVTASNSSVKAIARKTLHCTEKFNYMDLIHIGTTIIKV